MTKQRSIFNNRNLDVYIPKIRGYLKKTRLLRSLPLKGWGTGL